MNLFIIGEHVGYRNDPWLEDGIVMKVIESSSPSSDYDNHYIEVRRFSTMTYREIFGRILTHEIVLESEEEVHIHLCSFRDEEEVQKLFRSMVIELGMIVKLPKLKLHYKADSFSTTEESKIPLINDNKVFIVTHEMEKDKHLGEDIDYIHISGEYASNNKSMINYENFYDVIPVRFSKFMDRNVKKMIYIASLYGTVINCPLDINNSEDGFSRFSYLHNPTYVVCAYRQTINIREFMEYIGAIDHSETIEYSESINCFSPNFYRYPITSIVENILNVIAYDDRIDINIVVPDLPQYYGDSDLHLRLVDIVRVINIATNRNIAVLFEEDTVGFKIKESPFITNRDSITVDRCAELDVTDQPTDNISFVSPKLMRDITALFTASYNYNPNRFVIYDQDYESIADVVLSDDIRGDTLISIVLGMSLTDSETEILYRGYVSQFFNHMINHIGQRFSAISYMDGGYLQYQNCVYDKLSKTLTATMSNGETYKISGRKFFNPHKQPIQNIEEFIEGM